MSSLKDRINKEAENTGFRPHPVGRFGAKVIDVLEKEHEGRTIYEVELFTTANRKAKVAYWETSLPYEIERAGGDEEKGTDNFIKAMARLQRLFSDLEVQIAEVEGDDPEVLAKNYYNHIGKIMDKECTVAVVARKDKPGEVNTYINAPDGSNGKAASASKPKSDPPPTAPSDETFGAPPPGLDDIPF